MNIYPYRITEAREARQLNMSQLADSIGVTRQSVSRYEQGISSPSEFVLNKISSELQFPIGFFYKPQIDNVSNGTVFYRSLKSSEAITRSMIRVKCNWVYELYNCLTQRLILPDLNLPELDLLANKIPLLDDDIEDIASITRHHWKLGDGPIDNMTYLLESNGIVVSGSSITAEKTDACSEWISGVPIVFFDKSINSACRIRFSLAHELGHILMHSYITKEDLKDKKMLDRIEHEANRFASAFLLPQKSFINDVNMISLNYFLTLKKKWRVSLAAIIYRCKEINILDDNTALILRKQISVRKWRKKEPLDDEINIEYPQLLKSAIGILFKENLVSKSEFISIFSWNMKDLCDIGGCSQTLFENSNPMPVSIR